MKIKLFCLSYAGGTTMIYAKWKALLHKQIELCPVEMPGRGRRLDSLPCDTTEGLVNDLFSLISIDLGKCQYAFFGYSMGTLIIYELMRRILIAEYKNPLHIFFAGRFPPHMKEKNNIHLLPAREFKEEIIKLGGIPSELANDKELFQSFLPVLRVDYKIVENYKYINNTAPWNFDISVLSGKADKEVQDYNYMEWEMYTSKKCDFYEFEGGHFFIHNNTKQIVDLINQTLIRVY